MHRGCLERWRAWAGEAGVRLGDDFPFEAPTAGASEAIHALLALHLAGGARRIHVIVDLTYVGAVADPVDIDLRSPAVEAVVWSLSKPFGVYYHRVGGLVARAEIPTLRGHHWFKNLFSVHLGERLMAAHGVRPPELRVGHDVAPGRPAYRAVEEHMAALRAGARSLDEHIDWLRRDGDVPFPVQAHAFAPVYWKNKLSVRLRATGRIE
jgi:hypothetical protein